MSGWIVGDSCYADAVAAASAQCASIVGASSAGAVRCVGVAGLAPPRLTMQVVDAVGTVTASTVDFAAPSCDPMETYADIGALFTVAVTSLVTVSIVRQFVYKLVTPQ